MASSVLDRVAWPVRTDRLTIRPMTAADVEAVYAFRRLEEVHRWLSYGAPSLAAFRAVMTPERLGKTLVVEHGGRVVGDLMLAVEDAWGQREVEEQTRGVQAELGWVLDPAYAGRGLATEAVEALIRTCFVELGLRRVTAGCFAANEASWRLMERVGMRRESHTVKESLHRSGEWMDGYVYALLAEEWLNRSRAAGSPAAG